MAGAGIVDRRDPQVGLADSARPLIGEGFLQQRIKRALSLDNSQIEHWPCNQDRLGYLVDDPPARQVLGNLHIVFFRHHDGIGVFLHSVILLALPPITLGMLWVINPSYVAVLWVHWGLLVWLFVSEVIGALWIRKIINFDF